MVTGIIGSSSNQIQQLMAEMMKKMKSADTDGTSGLSKNELSSINTDNDPGGARFLKELSKNFDKIDSNSDGQLSKSEIDEVILVGGSTRIPAVRNLLIDLFFG